MDFMVDFVKPKMTQVVKNGLKWFCWYLWQSTVSECLYKFNIMSNDVIKYWKILQPRGCNRRSRSLRHCNVFVSITRPKKAYCCRCIEQKFDISSYDQNQIFECQSCPNILGQAVFQNLRSSSSLLINVQFHCEMDSSLRTIQLFFHFDHNHEFLLYQW